MSARAAKYRGFKAVPLAPCGTCTYVHNAQRCPQCGTASTGEIPAERRKPRHFEDAHQAALFDWIRLAKAAHPDLGKLYHVPNGGARDGREGGRLKAQGVRKGQLDLNLDVARGGYFGLRIELKATYEELGRWAKPSPEQMEIAIELRADGYAVEICHGWEAARDVLLAYVQRRPTISGWLP